MYYFWFLVSLNSILSLLSKRKGNLKELDKIDKKVSIKIDNYGEILNLNLCLKWEK